ncbi:hypothetical protein DFQ28_005897 [Apophysomyces sp. BC1034]|nr:hypothetical protein DFQ29_000858 [Apophysomyces sp. BC1021]KAG0187754.1 hypothetical protein DFQ28_005897 [Apophysomyces sp. BC1034]
MSKPTASGAERLQAKLQDLDDFEENPSVRKERERVMEKLENPFQLLSKPKKADINGKARATDVLKLWNDNDELQKVEIDDILAIINSLRPYVPKGRLGTAIALRVRFTLLSNTILHATGYSKFTANICPTISLAPRCHVHIRDLWFEFRKNGGE